MLKPIFNQFIISANLNEGETMGFTGIDGVPFIMSKQYNPLIHATQYGIIEEVPFSFDRNNINSQELKKGDKVYFHYLICQEQHQFFIDDKELYFCDYEMIFGKEQDGKLIPMNDHFFAAKFEDENEFEGEFQVQFGQKIIQQKVQVLASNNYIRSKGINEGDVVLTISGAGVGIKEEDFYWLKYVNCLAIEKNGELIPVPGKCLIEEYETDDRLYIEQRGVQVHKKYRSKPQTGKFLKGEGIKEGSDVTFLHGSFTKLNYKGINYAILPYKNLILNN